MAGEQEVQDFEPLETGQSQPAPPSQHPHDRGRPERSSREIASQAASEAVRGEQPDSTTQAGGGADREEPLPSEEREFVDFEQATEPEGQEFEEQEFEETEETQPAPEEPEGETGFESTVELTDEDYEMLQQEGIDLPVPPSEVPDEFQGLYGEMAQQLMDTELSARERTQKAQEAMLRVKDFADRLQSEEGQQRMLLGLAMQSPETFEETVKTFQRMQDDPEYAEQVRKQLEAEAKYEAATRKEQALEQTESQRKGERVERRTDRLARRFGVDQELAREMVAARILQNEQQRGQRDISLQEVDQVVKGLAKRMGKGRGQRTKSPKTQKKEREAPTQPTEGRGREPSGGGETQETRRPKEPSRGPSSNALDSLRDAVRQSARNIEKKGL